MTNDGRRATACRRRHDFGAHTREAAKAVSEALVNLTTT